MSYLPDGTIEAFTPTRDDVPTSVAKRTVMDLDEWPYPKQPLVPLAESVHERMSVEIFRGCTRGCRFLAGRMITRPRARAHDHRHRLHGRHRLKAPGTRRWACSR